MSTEVIRDETPIPVTISTNPVPVSISGTVATQGSTGLQISNGGVSGTTYVHKFGHADDFDTADSPISVWDGANDAGINQMAYQYSATADIDSISSSSGSDTFDVEIQGLDTSWNLTTQTVTLTGQTLAALSTSLIRVFRMKNVGAANNVGTVYCYVNSAITGGVPDDPTQVRAVMSVGYNQTLMAVYSVPNGKKAYMRSWYVSLAGANKAASYVADLFVRPFGQVFQIKGKRSINDESNQTEQIYVEPGLISAKSDIEIRVSIPTVGITAAGISAGFDLVLVDD